MKIISNKELILDYKAGCIRFVSNVMMCTCLEKRVCRCCKIYAEKHKYICYMQDCCS